MAFFKYCTANPATPPVTVPSCDYTNLDNIKRALGTTSYTAGWAIAPYTGDSSTYPGVATAPPVFVQCALAAPATSGLAGFAVGLV